MMMMVMMMMMMMMSHISLTWTLFRLWAHWVSRCNHYKTSGSRPDSRADFWPDQQGWKVVAPLWSLSLQACVFVHMGVRYPVSLHFYVYACCRCTHTHTHTHLQCVWVCFSATVEWFLKDSKPPKSTLMKSPWQPNKTLMLSVCLFSADLWCFSSLSTEGIVRLTYWSNHHDIFIFSSLDWSLTGVGCGFILNLVFQRQIYLQVLARILEDESLVIFLVGWLVKMACSSLCRLIRELISASHPGSRESRLSGTHSVRGSRGPAREVGPLDGSLLLPCNYNFQQSCLLS